VTVESESPGIPSVGQTLGGKYVLERRVGAGGMGIVFEARHERIGQRVAIKLLRPEVAARPLSCERFVREARAAGRLRSRHAVRIFDVDATERGVPYLVMEWLEGRDLDAELEERGPLPLDDVLRFLLEACDAIGEAHEAGIVHRDLKPSNLFLAKERDGVVCKVLDFGISKLPEWSDVSITQTDALLGTPLYMAPEQVRNARDVDARADVWALGVILYELLGGRPPFLGETVASTAAAIAADDPRPLRWLRPEVPEHVEDIVSRCLSKDASRRFADANAFAHALRGHLHAEKADLALARTEFAPPPASVRRDPVAPPANVQARTNGQWEEGTARSAAVRSRRTSSVAVAIAGAALVAAALAFAITRVPREPTAAGGAASPSAGSKAAPSATFPEGPAAAPAPSSASAESGAPATASATSPRGADAAPPIATASGRPRAPRPTPSAATSAAPPSRPPPAPASENPFLL
jgi:serine/threonine-protein kinase